VKLRCLCAHERRNVGSTFSYERDQFGRLVQAIERHFEQGGRRSVGESGAGTIASPERPSFFKLSARQSSPPSPRGADLKHQPAGRLGGRFVLAPT
jgi:hypothetical protein